MILKFEKIVLHNFMSFGDAELDLDASGYVLVSGVNNNPIDNASSNGSGKSSIWEAISWALTGETIRGGSKDIRNVFTEGGAFVELTFSVDNDTYKILRSKEHTQYKTNLKIYKNDVDISGKGIRDSEALLKEYLPDLTASLIGSVIILGQGLPQRFSNNTPSGRKDVLEKLSKSDFMIEDLKKRVMDRKIALNESLKTADGSINMITGSITILERNISNIQQKIDALNEFEFSDMDVKALEDVLQDMKSDRDDLIKNLDNMELELKAAEESVNCLKLAKVEATHEIRSKFSSEQQELSNSRRDLCHQIHTLQTEIKRLEDITDVCPTCKQKLPDVIKPDTSEQRDSLARLQDDLKAIDYKIDSLNDKSDAAIKGLEYSFHEKMAAESDKVNTLKSRVSSSKQVISGAESHIVAAEKKLSDMKATLSSRQSQLDQLAVDLEAANKQMVDLTEKILYNNNEKENIQRHIEVINRINALVTRDFRGYLLTGIINYIQSKAVEYSLQLFETDKISFSLDGNNINISYNGKLYEDLSGGEKQKVDLIIQFSIRDMLCKYLNFGCNILVLDEITDNLDDVGCEKVLNLVSTSLKDINSIYIISHRASDLAIPYDREIIVEKNNFGISEIK
jgi:DNA repair exonuclease SbcCD ATPase subunit